jgi:transcriptional regulator with XRE-family HTH domain
MDNTTILQRGKMNMDVSSIGNKIQSLREEHNMSQEQLANAIGCSQSALSNYEKGKRKLYLVHLEKLAEVFNKPMSYFIDDEPEEQLDMVKNENDSHLLSIIYNLYSLNKENLLDVESYIKYLLWKDNQEG